MRIYLASEGPHLLMRTLFNPGNGPFGVSMPGLGPTQQIKFSSDHQMARLANGDVLLMWQGSTNAPLSFVSPGQLQPAWWGDWNVMKQWDFDITGKSPVGDNQNFIDFLNDHIGGRNGLRSANLLWRFSASTCEWSATPLAFDAGEVSGIKRDLSKQVGYCAQLAPGLAGFDRLELYADPWGVDSTDSNKQRLYVSTLCGRCERPPCPALQNRALSDDNVQVFVSPDTGATWQPAMRINAPQPVVMTSTAPSGRFFMFNTTRDGDPEPGAKLYWLDPTAGGNSGHGPYDITYEVKDPKEPSKKIRYLPDWLDGNVVGVDHSGSAAPLSLARTGENSVLAVYPAVEEGMSSAGLVKRQIAVAVWVVTNANNAPPMVVPIKIIRADADRGSVLLPTLIEDDRRDAPSATTMLYWIETTSPISISQTEMVAKYTFFTNGIFPGSPAFLASPGWNASNTPPLAWLGDYMKGSFYFDGNNLNFAAAWPQVMPAGSPAKPDNQNTQAYIRIIKLQPQSLKPLPDPKGMPDARTAVFVGQNFLGNKP